MQALYPAIRLVDALALRELFRGHADQELVRPLEILIIHSLFQ